MRFSLRKQRASESDMYNIWNIYTIIDLVIKGAIVGAIGGYAAATFRYAVQLTEDYRWHLMAHLNGWVIAGWLVAMAVLGLIVYALLRWAPLSGGSGIPQIEGEMMGIFDMNAPRTMISKYLGGVCTGLAGFSVGREGPSVQLAGSIGKALAILFKSPLREQRILTSAGAGAGLTAAFSAPVSGAIFVFEEVHKSFYPALVIPTFTATLVSNYVTSWIFGLQPSLGFTVTRGVPIEYGGYLIALGIAIGFVGVVFNKAIIGFKKLFAWMTIPKPAQMVITFLIIGIIGLDSQLLLGGGHHLVGELASIRHAYWLLLFIIAGKILVTALCYGSGAQGGIFLPMLVIGAGVGALLEEVLVVHGAIPDIYLANFVICAMGGMLASAMRVPLLSILLVLEMTGSFHSIYEVGIVTIVAYLVAELCKESPIYDHLLELMIPPKEVATEAGPMEDGEQTFFEIKLPVISPHVGKCLKDLKAPPGVMIVSIERCGRRLVPQANTVLRENDQLYVSCTKERLENAKKFFQEAVA